jgi:hypothetical protein
VSNLLYETKCILDRYEYNSETNAFGLDTIAQFIDIIHAEVIGQ